MTRKPVPTTERDFTGYILPTASAAAGNRTIAR